ncbi:MAG: NTP transferase domain-containing protein [Hymenobacteraceae bacterium]|nr:NTP transferase domain-containing protein [Hymenobacteraceae bacterium]
MKAIIPVAGIGQRLRPHTHTQPKSLVPVADNTILGHIIERIRAAGIRDFVFVIGYLGEKIERFVRERYPDIRAEFVVQEPREGSGHALWVARELYRDSADGILIVLGDSIVDTNLDAIVRAPTSVLAVKPVKTPAEFGVVEVDASGRVTRAVEKPRIPKSNFALVGVYKIRAPAGLIAALDALIAEDRRADNNEFYLTDALERMIRAGEHFTVWGVDQWFDCGRKETLLEANATLLNRPGYRPAADYAAEFPDSIIIPPVSIGRGCRIHHSIIGPNVAIGDHTTITASILRESIIGAYSELSHAVLYSSIVGSDASFQGTGHSLNLGDDTEINFQDVGLPNAFVIR